MLNLKQWLSAHRSENPPFPGLFIDGLAYYLDGDYFDAHEVWEDLWRQTDPTSTDFVFYQGCIQLAVSRYHAQQGNAVGQRNLLNKALVKFKQLQGLTRYRFFESEWRPLG